jgi:hypothetical protein
LNHIWCTITLYSSYHCSLHELSRALD